MISTLKTAELAVFCLEVEMAAGGATSNDVVQALATLTGALLTATPNLSMTNPLSSETSIDNIQ